MPWTPNFSATSAGNCMMGKPWSLVSRERLPGASMYMRKGHEATAMRSRGAVGKSMCGLDCGAAKSERGVVPAIMLPAARVESVSRNVRRVSGFMVVGGTSVRNGFYDGWGVGQRVSAEERRFSEVKLSQ